MKFLVFIILTWGFVLAISLKISSSADPKANKVSEVFLGPKPTAAIAEEAMKPWKFK